MESIKSKRQLCDGMIKPPCEADIDNPKPVSPVKMADGCCGDQCFQASSRERLSPADVAEIFDKIDNLDLNQVRAKIKKEHGWDDEKIEKNIGLYKTWMKLLAQSGGGLAPLGPDMDEVWHTHILYTRDYARDCNAIFGRFVHHAPYEGTDITDEQRKTVSDRTKQMYMAFTGKTESNLDFCSSCKPDDGPFHCKCGQ